MFPEVAILERWTMKKDIITEITCSISAIQNNDKIGVIFFSDKIEKFIPPFEGKKTYLVHYPGIDRFSARRQNNDRYCLSSEIYDEYNQETLYGIWFSWLYQ